MCRLERQSRRSGTNWVCRLPAPAYPLLFCLVEVFATAQDLTPRAYVITPVDSNAVILSYSFSDGDVLLDPTLPIENFKGRAGVSVFSYYRSFSIVGRSANITLSVPYADAQYKATVMSGEARASRSGLADGRVRLSVNLRGGRAMSVQDFVSYREGVVIGASLTAVVPIGQYDPARIINPGANRWAMKPEIGFSKRWNHWVVDGYGGVWFFANNYAFFPGQSIRSQNAIGAGEAHFSYYFGRALWASFDGNFWAGGQSTINTMVNRDFAKNSRLGASVSIPLSRHQSLKFSFNKGAYIAIGGDYTTVSAGWQYHWVSNSE